MYRFGLLEDFDHLYRYSALLDRLEGKDANNILQSYTDIFPGRATMHHHRHHDDNVRRPYSKNSADFISKLHALTITSGEQQTFNYYMNIGPLFADPVARMLYAEIASVEEEHVTQYESLLDPTETLMEKWLLHEANEVYNYWSCVESETDPRIKAIWERFLDYELGHLNHVSELFKTIEGRDPAEILPNKLPKAISYKNQREFVRDVLAKEVGLRSNGQEVVPPDRESQKSIDYRMQMNSEGIASEAIAHNFKWIPGGELVGQTNGRMPMFADGPEVQA
jgi:rubrerythrin